MGDWGLRVTVRTTLWCARLVHRGWLRVLEACCIACLVMVGRYAATWCGVPAPLVPQVDALAVECWGVALLGFRLVADSWSEALGMAGVFAFACVVGGPVREEWCWGEPFMVLALLFHGLRRASERPVARGLRALEFLWRQGVARSLALGAACLPLLFVLDVGASYFRLPDVLPSAPRELRAEPTPREEAVAWRVVWYRYLLGYQPYEGMFARFFRPEAMEPRPGLVLQDEAHLATRAVTLTPAELQRRTDELVVALFGETPGESGVAHYALERTVYEQVLGAWGRASLGLCLTRLTAPWRRRVYVRLDDDLTMLQYYCIVGHEYGHTRCPRLDPVFSELGADICFDATYLMFAGRERLSLEEERSFREGLQVREGNESLRFELYRAMGAPDDGADLATMAAAFKFVSANPEYDIVRRIYGGGVRGWLGAFWYFLFE